MCTADVFVQPNIKAEGDMEGFRLVVLEAASYGLVVVASRLEGLEERNANKYKQGIEYFLLTMKRENNLVCKQENMSRNISLGKIL